MSSGIYIIKSKIDKRCYIGKSINVSKRLNSHKRFLLSNTHSNRHLQSFVNKYGLDSLLFEILEICHNKELLNEREKYWIKILNARKKGFNQTDGGEDNCRRKSFFLKNAYTGLEERGERTIHFAHKYGFSSGAVADVVNGKKRFIHGWYNPEFYSPKIYTMIAPSGVKVKIMELEITKFCVDLKLNEGNFREVLAKKRESCQGWKREDSTLNKESLMCIKPFALLSPLGEVVKGVNLREFAKKNGLSQPNLHAVISGRRKSHKGWKKYENS